MQKENKKSSTDERTEPSNSDLEGVDKAPGEEQGKQEKVTNNNLKGKKVDADPTQAADQPVEEKK